MDYLLHFVIGLLLSFIGSIPFGAINVTTAESAINDGLKVALWVAFGAALIEWIQATLSFMFSGFIVANPGVSETITYVSIPVLIGLGLYFLLKKKKEEAAKRGSGKGRGFLKGVIVSALNLLAYPYWIFYASYLSANGWIDLDRDMLVVTLGLGVLVGSFLILALYARLGALARERSRKIARYASPVVAGIFFVLAVVQLMRVL